MANSLWSNSKPSLNKKAKKSGYEGGAEKVLQFGEVHTGQRELERLKLSAELTKWKKAGRPPSVAEIQKRYSYTEDFAQKFLQKLARYKKRIADERQEPTAKKKAPPKKVEPLQTVVESPKAPSPVVIEPSAQSAQILLKTVLEDIRRRYGDEIKQKGEQTSAKEGFVYLVTHPCFDGWVKGGMTIDYELRLSTYNTSDPLGRFEYSALAWVQDRRQAERLLLGALQEIASDTRGEWFRMPVTEAELVFSGQQALAR